MSNWSTAKDDRQAWDARDRTDPSTEELSDEALSDEVFSDEAPLAPLEPAGPPLPGKTHPRAEMSDATPTVDDEVRSYHHHPSEAATTAFSVDPEAADAAADLAGDLGSQFLEGATRGEDMSDRGMNADDRSADEMPFLIDEDIGVDAEDEE